MRGIDQLQQLTRCTSLLKGAGWAKLRCQLYIYIYYIGLRQSHERGLSDKNECIAYSRFLKQCGKDMWYRILVLPYNHGAVPRSQKTKSPQSRFCTDM